MGNVEETEEAPDWEEAVSDRNNAAVYIRVSTTDQNSDMQETELLEYCKRRGWEPILYRDRGQSGANGYSGEGEHRFRREAERHSGAKVNSSRSEATLAW